MGCFRGVGVAQDFCWSHSHKEETSSPREQDELVEGLVDDIGETDLIGVKLEPGEENIGPRRTEASPASRCPVRSSASSASTGQAPISGSTASTGRAKKKSSTTPVTPPPADIERKKRKHVRTSPDKQGRLRLHCCDGLTRNKKGYVVSKAASAKALSSRPAGFDRWAKAREKVREDHQIRLLLTSCLYIM